MRVLAACEWSGRVRDAFRGKGHEAFSCDLDPGEGEFTQYHIRDDVRNHLEGWDLIIGFPPCTYLSKIRNGSLEPKWVLEERQAAFEFVLRLWEAPCDRVAIENPVGRLSSMWRPPDQIIQPFWFGAPYTKQTCLWVRGLPLLQRDPELYWHGPLSSWTQRVNNQRIRSMTFPGVALGMARQWGSL